MCAWKERFGSHLGTEPILTRAPSRGGQTLVPTYYRCTHHFQWNVRNGTFLYISVPFQSRGALGAVFGGGRGRWSLPAKSRDFKIWGLGRNPWRVHRSTPCGEKGALAPGGCVLWRAEPGLARRADDAFLRDAVAYRRGIPCFRRGAHWARAPGILRCRCARPGLPSCLASPRHSYRGSPPRKRSFRWWAISFISRVLCCLALALAQDFLHCAVDSRQFAPHDLHHND